MLMRYRDNACGTKADPQQHSYFSNLDLIALDYHPQ